MSAMPPVVFTRTIPGITDPATGVTSDPVTTTIGGYGAIVKGEPQRYAALSLSIAEFPTILFRASSLTLRAFTPEFVLPGDIAVINGVSFVAKFVDPVAPAGNVVIARIICSAGLA